MSGDPRRILHLEDEIRRRERQLDMDIEARRDRAAERASRADRIERLWEEEGLGAVIEEWETTLYERFLETDATQDKERFRLQTAILMGRKFKDHILGIVRDGELARRELKDIAEGRRAFF